MLKYTRVYLSIIIVVILQIISTRVESMDLAFQINNFYLIYSLPLIGYMFAGFVLKGFSGRKFNLNLEKIIILIIGALFIFGFSSPLIPGFLLFLYAAPFIHMVAYILGYLIGL
jgi:hypothetical protein